MYNHSAQLVAYICYAYKLAVSREIILGHDENAKVGGTSNHVDPGLDWDWDLYMSLVQWHYNRTCGWPTLSRGHSRQLISAIQYLLLGLGYKLNVTSLLDNETGMFYGHVKC